jgi:DNA polymerase-3 subunit alpha
VKEREENGPFKSIEDFMMRVNPSSFNRRQLENLIASGALDQLNPNRKQLFASADTIIRYSHNNKRDKASTRRSLFGEAVSEKNPPLPLVQDCGEWNFLEKTQKEFEAVGFFLKDHPLDLYKDVTQKMYLQNSSCFQHVASDNGTIVRFAAIILFKEERVSRGGSKFAFITFSDKFGIFEVPFFAENYAKVKDLIEPGLAVYVEVTVKTAGTDGSYKLAGNVLERLDKKAKSQVLNLYCSQNADIDSLKKILNQDNNGSCSIIIRIKLCNITAKITLPPTYDVDPQTKANILSIPGFSLTSSTENISFCDGV